MGHSLPLQINFGQRRVGDSTQSVAIFKCGKEGCTSKLEFPAVSGQNYRHLTKRAAQSGWDVDPHNRRNNRCPTCQGKKKRVDPDENNEACRDAAKRPIKTAIKLEVQKPLGKPPQVIFHIPKAFPHDRLSCGPHNEFGLVIYNDPVHGKLCRHNGTMKYVTFTCADLPYDIPAETRNAVVVKTWMFPGQLTIDELPDGTLIMPMAEVQKPKTETESMKEISDSLRGIKSKYGIESPRPAVKSQSHGGHVKGGKWYGVDRTRFATMSLSKKTQSSVSRSLSIFLDTKKVTFKRYRVERFGERGLRLVRDDAGRKILGGSGGIVYAIVGAKKLREAFGDEINVYRDIVTTQIEPCPVSYGADYIIIEPLPDPLFELDSAAKAETTPPRPQPHAQTVAAAASSNKRPPPSMEDLEQRNRIRLLLDANFYWADGQYINNYDDARIANEVGVEPNVVATLRDIAYGPIQKKATAADAQLVDEVKNTMERMSALMAQLEARGLSIN